MLFDTFIFAFDYQLTSLTPTAGLIQESFENNDLRQKINARKSWETATLGLVVTGLSGFKQISE
jgi:hypothetical protein